ncbi:MAG: hypothetical protein IPM64_11390 [Phycisphaerales bacterium]|nr:hypothetical protein [Phycisphaerales bacterium]
MNPSATQPTAVRPLLVCAGAITLFTLLALWPLSSPPHAAAQVPDSGAQRAAMLVEMRTTNQRLAEIIGLLKEIRANTAAPAAKPQTASPQR